MAKIGCPSRLVRQFHDDMQACVQNNGKYSGPFPVTDGVTNGCVMAPTLFSIIVSVMFFKAMTGFPIRYCFDGT